MWNECIGASQLNTSLLEGLWPRCFMNGCLGASCEMVVAVFLLYPSWLLWCAPGKTTLMTAVSEELQARKQFETVAWVTVTQNPDLVKCQKQIWQQVVREEPPEFDDAEDGRRRLSARLLNENGVSCCR